MSARAVIKLKRLPVAAAFWFIWCPTERAPRHRHTSLQGACAEAQRLRAKHPDREFLVYAAQRQELQCAQKETPSGMTR